MEDVVLGKGASKNGKGLEDRNGVQEYFLVGKWERKGLTSSTRLGKNKMDDGRVFSKPTIGRSKKVIEG